MTNIEILEFKIENFTSINSEITVNFADKDGLMRPITAFFGANASGKSNIAKAYDVFLNTIINSCNANYRLIYLPFRLQVRTITSPTSFSIKFIHSKNTYEYGYSYTSEKIIREFLRIKNKNTNNYSYIFERQKDTLNPSAKNFGFNQGIFKKTRPNSLLITKAFEDNNSYATIVQEAVRTICVFTCDINRSEHIAINLMKDNPDIIEQLNSVLKKADFSLRKFEINNIHIPEEVLLSFMAPEPLKNTIRQNGALSLNTKHYLRNGRDVVEQNGAKMYVTMNISDESMGTRDFIGLMTPILYGAKIGGTAFIDEFGAYLHPVLAKAIISTCKNLYKKNGLRLIINTHNTYLMNYLDVDDCILVEKDRIEESTTVIPLKKRVKNISFTEKNYNNNRLGAVGMIDEVLI